jgi:hypothetical protein
LVFLPWPFDRSAEDELHLHVCTVPPPFSPSLTYAFFPGGDLHILDFLPLPASLPAE